MGSASVSALSQAHAVALSARVGSLDGAQVAALARISDAIDVNDPLRGAVAAFCARHYMSRHDRAALAEAGDDLHRAVLRAVRPAPVDIGRSDIYG